MVNHWFEKSFVPLHLLHNHILLSGPFLHLQHTLTSPLNGCVPIVALSPGVSVVILNTFVLLYEVLAVKSHLKFLFQLGVRFNNASNPLFQLSPLLIRVLIKPEASDICTENLINGCFFINCKVKTNPVFEQF